MTDWYLRLSERRPRQRVQKKSRLVKDQAALLPSTDTQRRPPEEWNGPRMAILPHFHGKVNSEFTIFGLSTAAEKPQRGPRSGPGGPRRGARKTRPRAGAKPPGGHAHSPEGSGEGRKKGAPAGAKPSQPRPKTPAGGKRHAPRPQRPGPPRRKRRRSRPGGRGRRPRARSRDSGPEAAPPPAKHRTTEEGQRAGTAPAGKAAPGPRGARSRTRPGPQTGATGGPQGRPGGGERSEGENAGPPPRQRGRSRRAADGDSRPAAGAATGGNPGGLRKKPPQTCGGRRQNTACGSGQGRNSAAAQPEARARQGRRHSPGPQAPGQQFEMRTHFV